MTARNPPVRIRATVSSGSDRLGPGLSRRASRLAYWPFGSGMAGVFALTGASAASVTLIRPA
jgi:hypothetical protein